MWQLLKETPKGMLKVMPKQAKVRASKMQTEEEDKDEEGLPEHMGEDAAEEPMQPTQNQHWRMRRMKEQCFMQQLTTVERRISTL